MTRILTLLVAAGLLCACESGQKTTSGLGRAVEEYQRQNYQSSHQQANAAMRSSRGADRDRAAYIAGLSAFELGMINEAERRFIAAARSADTGVAASAHAMLGQIRLQQARYDDAAAYLSDAASGLHGEDARQARRLADMARRISAGDETAGVSFRIETAHPVAMPDHGFALQVGAFHERHRANRAADEARSIAERNNLGQVQVVNSTDQRGRPLYLVRLGHFETRRAAAEARQRIGRLDYIVATWGSSHRDG